MRGSAICQATLILCLAISCNNYDLLEKIENPGGEKERYSDRLFIFATTQTTQGNLTGLNAGSCGGSGLARADCVCTALAAQHHRRMGPDRRFIAWLSTSVEWARCRMLGGGGNACTSPTGAFTWYNTAMQPVFTSYEATATGLLGNAPALPNAPQFTENGAMAPTVANDVWTGTALGGTNGTTHCAGWTDGTNASTADTGTVFHTGTSWTASTALGCDIFKRIYCIALP